MTNPNLESVVGLTQIPTQPTKKPILRHRKTMYWSAALMLAGWAFFAFPKLGITGFMGLAYLLACAVPGWLIGKGLRHWHHQGKKSGTWTLIGTAGFLATMTFLGVLIPSFRKVLMPVLYTCLKGVKGICQGVESLSGKAHGISSGCDKILAVRHSMNHFTVSRHLLRYMPAIAATAGLGVCDHQATKPSFSSPTLAVAGTTQSPSVTYKS